MQKQNSPRFDYEEYIKNLNEADQRKELLQFFIDMMDWTEQSDEEEKYIFLHTQLNEFIHKETYEPIQKSN